jgi:hypothetical protein
MTSTRHFVLAAGALGFCVMAAAIVTLESGWAVPRPQAIALRGAAAAVHEDLEQWESRVPAGRHQLDALWRAHLDLVEQELAQGRVDVAVRTWHDAYGAALASRSWESMIAVGDAFMAIGRASGSVRGARLNARDAYVTALIRARREGSVAGVLRSAEAFRSLDDRVIAEQCLHMAARLAGSDEGAQQLVSEARQRLTAERETAGS